MAIMIFGGKNSGFHATRLTLSDLQLPGSFPRLRRMKRCIAAVFGALFCASIAFAQTPDPRALGVLDEKVSRLGEQVQALEFQQQQIQKDIESLRAELQPLRRAAGGVAPGDLKALEDRIAAVDAARQADKKAIIDQLARELAGLGKSAPAPPAPSAGAKEYVVQKGDTLSSIAKANGVTVADLKKANSLTGDDIKVGQKLVIPK
jgi:TolA-binding protein